METTDIYFPLLAFPGSLAIIGATFSGKTTLLCKIIKYKENLFTRVPKTIVYCYGEHPSELLSQFNDIVYHAGLPTQEQINEWVNDYGKDGLVLCLDDLSGEFYSDKNTQALISRVVHHNNLFLIVIGHSLFPPGKYARFTNLNMHSYLLTRSCRDLNPYAIFGRQIWGNSNGAHFVRAFIDATEIKPNQKAGYLFITTHPIYTKRGCNVFSNIFPGEPPLLLYKVE